MSDDVDVTKPNVTDEQAEDAALAMSGRAVEKDDPSCGLRDVLGALGILDQLISSKKVL